MSRRAPIARHIRLRVYARDGHSCRYCDRGPDELTFVPSDRYRGLRLDHAVPVTRGGSNRQANLVTACDPCNFEKGDMTEAEYVDFLNRRYQMGVAA